jgi:N-acetylneuraminic acid mutarotase
MRARIAICLLAAAMGCGDDGTPGDSCRMTSPWGTAPGLPVGPAQEMAAVAVDGKIYVIGGFLAGELGNVVQVFDTEACTWSMGPNLPKDIHHLNATVVGDTIYVVGAMQGGPYTPLGDTWSWNPATEAGWTVHTPMPAGTERGSSVVGVIDGKIYVVGGLRYTGAIMGMSMTDVSIYDPIADAWTAGPPLPVPRDHGCGGVVGGKLYVTGGRVLNPGTPSELVFELTPGVGWTPRASMPTGRAGSACGVIGDRIIVAGGEGNPAPGSRGVFPQVEAYDPRQDTWATLAPMPTPRHGMAGTAWDGRLYTLGGGDQQGAGAVSIQEVLTP